MSAQSNLDELFTLLRFPSVSTASAHKQDVRDCADWLHSRLGAAGLTAKIHETPGHPVVTAKNEHKPGRPTVLLYGHYDVQPEDPVDLWTSPPFQPEVRDGIIYGRGSADNKGQHFAHLLGTAAEIEENGDLPVNITYLIEGEEEIGSPNLEPFLEAEKSYLKNDIVAISDTGMVAPGTPTFTYGLRGIACLEFIIHGPQGDLHSGLWGGSIANPASVASMLVGSFHDWKTGRIAIDGFYDTVEPLQDWEREAWKSLPGDKATLDVTGAPALWGEESYTTLERRWARPTAEINGIGSGYQGEGSKTVLPAKALVKVSFRLVPGQDPDDILAKAKAHLYAKCPSTVRLEVIDGHNGKPYAMDPHSRFGKAAQGALETTFGKETALIREGGSIPIVQSFKDVLASETLLLGLALPDCNAHAPDENFPVENFEKGITLHRQLMRSLAEA